MGKWVKLDESRDDREAFYIANQAINPIQKGFTLIQVKVFVKVN